MGTDLSQKESSNTTQIVGRDEVYAADVVLEDGIRKLATTKKVNVESLSGVGESASNYFFMDSVADGQTLIIDIAATEGAPAFSKTFTVTGGETKLEFTSRVILELNQDFVNFQPYYRALDIDDNAAIFIQAKTIGEAGEALTIDDFNITGTVPSQRGFDNLQRRSAVIQASVSTKDPRLGVFGIEGTVESVSADVSGLFIVQPYSGGDPANIEMNINAGGGVEYTFPMDALDDLFISEIKFFGLDSGITYANFLGRNSDLTNGIQVEIKTNNSIVTLPLIKATDDFADKFTFGGNSNFFLDKPSGLDKFTASFISAPFPLRRAGTFGVGNDDYIKITIQDNLSQVSKLQCIVEGVRREA